MGEWALLIHAAATWYMTGIIWFVQRVHYPLMDGVGADGFVAYERRHMQATMPVVAAGMLVEAVTAIMLPFTLDGGLGRWDVWLNLALLAVIWVTTAALSMPAHRRLGAGFNAATHRRLIASNLIRTAVWSVRAVLVCSMLGGVL